jgi:hypothetical protein
MKLNIIIQGIISQETQGIPAIEFKQQVIIEVVVMETKSQISIYNKWTQTTTQMHRRVIKIWQAVMPITLK